MNPVVLLLLAAAANNNRQGLQGFLPQMESFKLDTVLNQLQSAVTTLEKVNQIAKISAPSRDFSLPAPTAARATAPIEQTSDPQPEIVPTEPPLPNIDLQSAMQALGPLLSMLGGGQNSK